MKSMIMLAGMGWMGIAHAAIVANSATADAYLAINAKTAFGTKAVVSAKNSTGQQYSVLRFDLPSQSITGATFRLEWNSAPAAWGGGANATPMDVGVLSAANNNLWGEKSVNWFAANTNEALAAVAWKDSSGADVADADGLRDATMLATMTKYIPSTNWANGVYDIVLNTNTVYALEALRAAGETSATIFIQSRDGGNTQVGNRFDSHESTANDGSMAPQLVMETAGSSAIVPASIMGFSPESNNFFKLVVSTPSGAANYFPLGTSDLLASNGWSAVAHTDSITNALIVTNLAYSTLEGSNQVIYVQYSQSSGFFGISNP